MLGVSVWVGVFLMSAVRPNGDGPPARDRLFSADDAEVACAELPPPEPTWPVELRGHHQLCKEALSQVREESVDHRMGGDAGVGDVSVLALWVLGIELRLALLLAGVAPATAPAATVDVCARKSSERGAHQHATGSCSH